MKKLHLLILYIFLFGLLNLQAYSQDAQVIELTLDSYEFIPDKIVVEVNRPVELHLKSVTSLIPHNITIDDPESGIDFSQDVGAGDKEVLRFTPTKTGTYEFYCNKKNIFANHRKKGMVGTIEVVENKE